MIARVRYYGGIPTDRVIAVISQDLSYSKLAREKRSRKK